MGGLTEILNDIDVARGYIHGLMKELDDSDHISALLYGSMVLLACAEDEFCGRYNPPTVKNTLGGAMYRLACASSIAWHENDEESHKVIADATDMLRSIL